MKFTGVVIAGGKSFRMGKDKKQILYQGQSFLERAIGLLSKFTDEVVVSSNTDCLLPVHIIKDEIPDIGPIGGIYSVLKNIKNEYALVIPTDLPLLDEEILSHLIGSFDRKSDACVFEINHQTEALVGIYHKNILSFMEKQIDQGEYKMQILLEKVVAQKISADAFKDKFININTPQDLKKLTNV